MTASELKQAMESPRMLGLVLLSSSVGGAVRTLRADAEFQRLIGEAASSPALGEFIVNRVHQLAKDQPSAGYGHPNDLEMIAYLVCLADAKSERLPAALGMARRAVNAQWTAKVVRGLSLGAPTSGTVTFAVNPEVSTPATSIATATLLQTGTRSENLTVAA